jgi:hypothetical protein
MLDQRDDLGRKGQGVACEDEAPYVWMREGSK